MSCAEQEGQGARSEQFLDLNVERDEPPRKLSCAILLSLPRNSAVLSVTSFSSSLCSPSLLWVFLASQLPIYELIYHLSVGITALLLVLSTR